MNSVITKHKILFTGGGSAGHVTPNLALIAACRNRGWNMLYVGSKAGIEQRLITAENIPYFAIATGKLRRYFSLRNFSDPFKVVWGIVQAYRLCRQQKPNWVFSKGGFVALGVVVGAWLNKIPVIIHESDLTPGLANKMCAHFATDICVSFAETERWFKSNKKVVVTGPLIRPALFQADSEKGRKFLNFNSAKPILLIMGGGLGALRINQVVRAILSELLKTFQVVHLCGQSKTDAAFNQLQQYRQFEYLTDQFADILAASDLVISRAGANSIAEIVALKKPNILIPLAQAGRGDQVENAHYYSDKGVSVIINEAELTPELLLKTISETYQDRGDYLNNLKQLSHHDAVGKIMSLLSTMR